MLFYAILCYTMQYYTILYYTILYYTILYYTILYYTILYYTILYYTILYYTILYYTILLLYYTILYYTILYYTILYYTPRSPNEGPIPEPMMQAVVSRFRFTAVSLLNVLLANQHSSHPALKLIPLRSLSRAPYQRTDTGDQMKN